MKTDKLTKDLIKKIQDMLEENYNDYDGTDLFDADYENLTLWMEKRLKSRDKRVAKNAGIEAVEEYLGEADEH